MTEKTTQKSVKWPQIVAGLSACGGAFSVGTALGWPAPVGPRLVAGDDQYFKIKQSEFDWTASMITIGCAISCLPIGILMKKFGRKWSMLSLVVPFIVGWSLVTWAQNFVMLMIGRFIIGLAGGAFLVSAPQYSSEISEKEIRGTVGTFCVSMLNAGIVLVYIVGAYASVFWTNIVCAVIPVMFGVVFYFMPESPAFLIAERRDEDAVKAYKWLRGENYNPQYEMDELKFEIVESQRTAVSFGENLKKKSTQRALLIGFGLMFFQQMSGINVVLFYATFIFKAAKTGMDEDVQTIIVGAVLLIACLAGGFVVDRLGRKLLLLISAFFMTLMLIALGVYFFLVESESEVVDSLGWLPLTSLCIFLISYSLGFGPLPWLLISEVYSKDYNAIASPLNGCFSWLLAFAVTGTFGSISDAIGIGATFMIFAGLSCLGIFFTYFVVIETKAKTMLEIQRILAGEKNV